MEHLWAFTGLHMKSLSTKLQQHTSMPLLLSPFLDTSRLVFRLQFILPQQISSTYRHVCKIAKKWLLASPCLSVCPSVRPSAWNNLWLPQDEFSWNLTFIFWKSVKKIQVSFKYCKKNRHRHFTWWLIYVYDNITPNLLRMRNVSHKGVQKIRTFYVQ